MGTHLTPNGPEPSDNTPVIKHEPVHILCQECGQIMTIKDVHAYLLAVHLGVCSEMVLFTGERD